MAGDRPRQPAYEIFSIECRIQILAVQARTFYIQGVLSTQVSKRVPPLKSDDELLRNVNIDDLE